MGVLVLSQPEHAPCVLALALIATSMRCNQGCIIHYNNANMAKITEL